MYIFGAFILKAVQIVQIQVDNYACTIYIMYLRCTCLRGGQEKQTEIRFEIETSFFAWEELKIGRN